MCFNKQVRAVLRHIESAIRGIAAAAFPDLLWGPLSSRHAPQPPAEGQGHRSSQTLCVRVFPVPVDLLQNLIYKGDAIGEERNKNSKISGNGSPHS